MTIMDNSNDGRDVPLMHVDLVEGCLIVVRMEQGNPGEAQSYTLDAGAGFYALTPCLQFAKVGLFEPLVPLYIHWSDIENLMAKTAEMEPERGSGLHRFGGALEKAVKAFRRQGVLADPSASGPESPSGPV
jgi:hypothetical protein